MWSTDDLADENKTEKVDFDLDLHTYRLLQAEPFFAALSRRIHKSSTTAIPTAGVRMNEGSGNFEMVYNPKFFATFFRPCRQAMSVLSKNCKLKFPMP